MNAPRDDTILDSAISFDVYRIGYGGVPNWIHHLCSYCSPSHDT
jgi:hypothetical protein